MNTIIFISDNLSDIKNIKKIAKNKNYSVKIYSTKTWSKNNILKFNKKKLKKNSKQNSRNTSNIIHLNAPHVSKNFNTSKIVPIVSTDFNITMNDIRKTSIIKALLLSRGCVSKAAQNLNIGRATIYRNIIKFKINPQNIRNSLQEKTQKTQNKNIFKKTA